MQWLVLRRYLERAGWWAVASTAGFLVGFIMFGLAISTLEVIGIDILEGDALAAIFYPLLGSALGITGWLVLRNYFVQAGWWIPATLASWILTGLMVGKSIDKTIDFLLVGLVPTAISGLALVWFLYHQNSDNSRVAKSAP
jgi:hypothetical protein